MKKRIVSIVIAALILAGLFVFLPGALSCSESGDSELPGVGINTGEEALLAHISRIKNTSANKSTQIQVLNDKVYALELENINMALEIESLRNHIKSMPGEAGYKGISLAWTVCQEQLQEALPYKERFANLSESWEEHRAILTGRVSELESELEEVTTNLTICTANLTLCLGRD